MSIRAAIVLLLSLSAAGPLYAETAYVVDEFEITMRSGKGTGYQIVRMLKSGQPVEVLERDIEAGYAKVRTAQGREGWVLLRFLSPEPAARAQLAEARRQLEALQAGTLTDELNAARQTIAALEEQRASLVEENRTLANQLDELRERLAEPMQLAEQNDRYRQQLREQQALEETLRQENRRLRRGAQRRWFVVGAGVLGGGILLGLILPLLRPRRRKRWNEL